MANKSLTDVPEQSHDAMRAAAMRRVNGPGATPVQAAGGGLDVPGGEAHDTEVPIVGIDHRRTHEPIPGERDETTLTHREPGSMGGAFNGQDVAQANARTLMDERTVREHVREGGGEDAERRLRKQRTP